MSSDPFDPFKEERKRRRLLDEAMPGPARQFLEEEQKRRRLLDQAMGGSVQRFFEEEQKRRRIFKEPATLKAAQEIVNRQKEQERLLQPYSPSAIQRYFDAEDARRKAFDVGSLSSAKAFQDNIATAMQATAEPFTKLSMQMRESGVFDRIAEQQSALIKASAGITSQIEAAQTAIQNAIPTASQISASFGVQSALVEQMRRISKQVSQLDQIAHMGGIQESALWETIRDTYGLNNEMSVSQAFQEIGTKLDQPSETGKPLKAYDAWQLIQFLWLVFTAYAMIAGWGDYTKDDRTRDEVTAVNVERIEALDQMREVESAIAEASALTEIARINELPRAYVRDVANVRVAPEQKAERLARLRQDTMVAIEAKKGRWLRIIYADPLTEELAEGWVWGGSIELMSSSDFEAQMAVAREVMARRRQALRELAK